MKSGMSEPKYTAADSTAAQQDSRFEEIPDRKSRILFLTILHPFFCSGLL